MLVGEVFIGKIDEDVEEMEVSMENTLTEYVTDQTYSREE